MPCGNAFSNIEPGAVINGTWDFAPWLAVGESIASIVSTACAVERGEDLEAADRLLQSLRLTQSPSSGEPNCAVCPAMGKYAARRHLSHDSNDHDDGQSDFDRLGASALSSAELMDTIGINTLG